MFSRFYGNFFRCYFKHLFLSLAFRKCKKHCNILKTILVKFSSTKILLKLLDFILEFVLTTIGDATDISTFFWDPIFQSAIDSV